MTESSPRACLVQSQARRDESKGAGTAGCNAGLASVQETGERQRRNGRYLSTRCAERSPPVAIPGGGRHPGFRKRVTLRGVTQERGPRSVHEVGGRIQPAARRSGDIQGCSSSSREEGNLRPRRPAAAGGGRVGPSLGAARPAQSSAVLQRPSPQTVVGSRRRPQAAFRSEGSFRGLISWRACSAVGGGSGRAVRGSQRSLSFFERGRSAVPSKASSGASAGST
jgi:hypothetical protein